MTKFFYLLIFSVLLASCTSNYEQKRKEREYQEDRSENRFDKLYKELDDY